METIAAISTAMGNGGIGIIRMSGKETFNILSKIFVNPNGTKLDINNIVGYTIKYGFIVNSEDNEKIDEVLVSFFKNPKSYTKEDMCEINSHGGMIVERLILEQCLKNGAMLAEPGEFTKRAFLNGRIDLSQAESVIDIINSKSQIEAKASINQLEGVLSEKIQKIRHSLLDLMADVEAQIDYPEYDFEDLEENNIINVLEKEKEELIKLKDSFESGKVLKEGIKTAIVGKPNAGKSSLLNSILKEDRAIVSDIEGTTRDTIEEQIIINGVPLKIIDTAGIRKTDDKIEKIGVDKTLKILEEAELVLALFDNTKELSNEDLEILKLIKNKNAIILLNKIDIENNNFENEKKLNEIGKKVIKISAKNLIGIDELYFEIEKMFNLNEINSEDGIIITNVRHKNQIEIAQKDIEKAIEDVKNNMPIDIISINIINALNNLGKITGENVTEDIINEIFSKFCLGK